jgi:hypothetical protein
MVGDFSYGGGERCMEASGHIGKSGGDKSKLYSKEFVGPTYKESTTF